MFNIRHSNNYIDLITLQNVFTVKKITFGNNLLEDVKHKKRTVKYEDGTYI